MKTRGFARTWEQNKTFGIYYVEKTEVQRRSKRENIRENKMFRKY
jgi:hypothetical protein